MSSRARLGLKVFVWLVGLAPLTALAYWFWTDDLTANPIEFVTRTLGDWALRMLLASLAMTPLRLLFGVSWPLTLRRLLGLFAFAYVVLHFGVWILLDHFFDWRTMGDDTKLPLPCDRVIKSRGRKRRGCRRPRLRHGARPRRAGVRRSARRKSDARHRAHLA